MADLGVSTIYDTSPRGGRDSYIVANSVTVVEGQLASLEAGYLNHWADGANDVFLGILVRGDATDAGVITGNTSGSPPPEATVDTSGVTLMHLTGVASANGAISAANVGDLVYCPDSDVANLTIDTTGNTHPIGYIKYFRGTTDIDVRLFTPEEFLAQATA